MAIIRSTSQNPDDYYYIDSDLYYESLRDCRLSLKAKAIFLMILGEKEDDIFSEHDFITNLDKYESVGGALKELLKFNYISKTKGSIHGYVLDSNKEKIVPSDKSGYVYVIDNNYGDIKIGMAVNIEQRFKEHRCSMPYEPIVIKIIKCNNMREKEKYLHDKFSSKRLNGEWFKLSNEDIEYIKSIKDDVLVVGA